jgi:hypothetical protein
MTARATDNDPDRWTKAIPGGELVFEKTGSGSALLGYQNVSNENQVMIELRKRGIDPSHYLNFDTADPAIIP